MRRNHRVAAAALATAVLVLAAGAAAQDFQKSYSLEQGGLVKIRNVSGNVTVTGYGGAEVVVLAYKEGRDRDRVEIEDLSAPGRVDVRVRYPDFGNTDATINFEVHVPASVSYNFEGISSVSGNVEISRVSGKIRAEAVSGNVAVTDVTGSVSASAVSGNVDVHIARLEGAGDMRFSTVSGNVSVRAPAGLNAYVEMSTISGSLKTDFPLEVIERRYGPGRSARGRLGEGRCRIRISSVSGRVSLMKS